MLIDVKNVKRYPWGTEYNKYETVIKKLASHGWLHGRLSYIRKWNSVLGEGSFSYVAAWVYTCIRIYMHTYIYIYIYIYKYIHVTICISADPSQGVVRVRTNSGRWNGKREDEASKLGKEGHAKRKSVCSSLY